MRPPIDFSESYKLISNTELLNILDHPGDYQPLAVEAAKNELLKRQLSETEIKEAREPIIAKQIQKEKQREKTKEIENKLKTAGYTLIDTLNPIQTGIPSTEKIIRLIVIVFGGLFLYQLIKDFKVHMLFIKDIPRFPFESTLYLAPLILLPIAIFTFGKKIRIGWFLLAIFLVFSTVGVLWVLIQYFLLGPPGNSGLDRFFPHPSISTLIIQLIFFGGTLYTICKQNMRNEFSISENKMLATIIITGVLTFFLTYTNS
ncbi:MAG TPA: hypothetical protein VGQ04_08375 [Chitinophagaceae bacterium]|jgi:hypothetical protein|nr:hypothetical protein [Chitinophagaceae bacterium]